MPSSYLYRSYRDTNELNMTIVLGLLDCRCSKGPHRLLWEKFQTVIAGRTGGLKPANVAVDEDRDARG